MPDAGCAVPVPGGPQSLHPAPKLHGIAKAQNPIQGAESSYPFPASQ